MTPRNTRRTQQCSDADASIRLRHAHKFIEVADLVADEGNEIEFASQAASLAVLAGIAGGKEAAKSLARLLSLKDEAQYGMSDVGGQTLRSAMRQAVLLIGLAEKTLQT
jgi:hypothetical protein